MKKRPKLNKSGGAGGTVTPILDQVSSSAPPVASDLSKVIDESKLKLAENAEQKRGRGRQKGWRKPPEVTPSPAAPNLAVKLPGPAAPMFAEVHENAAIMVGAWMGRDFKLEKEESKNIGDQFDVLLQWYLPDLEKDPKRLALYTYAFTLSMVGIRIIKSPRIKKGSEKVEPREPSTPARDTVEKNEPEVQREFSNRVAPTSDPTAYYDSLS